MRGERAIRLVQVHRHTQRSQVLREADVIGVAVGQHDRLDVADRAPRLREPRTQVAPVTAKATVDEGDRTTFCEREEVHSLAAQQRDAREHLLRLTSGRKAIRRANGQVRQRASFHYGSYHETSEAEVKCYAFLVIPDSHQHCPAGHALALLGDRWSLMIVREALRGAERFDAFRQSLAISEHTLSRKLTHLQEVGVLTRAQDGSYALTEAGEDLAQVLAVLGHWGQRWLPIEQPALTPPPAVMAAAVSLGLAPAKRK